MSLHCDQKKFLALSKPDRLKYIAQIIKKHDSDDTSHEMRNEFKNLLDEIEICLYSKIKIKDATKAERDIFSEIISSRKFLTARGSSPKMIFEYLSLLI